MLQYSEIANHPREVLELTSLTVKDFESLLTPFKEAFQEYMAHWRIDGEPRTQRRRQTAFILLYLKNNPNL